MYIGNRKIGSECPTYVIAEIGINHNGDIEIAKKLIQAAVWAGCDAVKFQKRTPNVLYDQIKLASRKESPWGQTYGAYAIGREFGEAEYDEIDKLCGKLGIDWFASCWDTKALAFMSRYSPPCYKIASACMTNDKLIFEHAMMGTPIIMSRGMCSLDDISGAIGWFGEVDVALLHCVSTYPTKPEHLNLNAIVTLKKKFPQCEIGYSGHEVGMSTTLGAVALGATITERHLTLDRTMWGSDQAASIEPYGMEKLVRYIRTFEKARGDGEIKVEDCEKNAIKRLRG